MASLSTNQAFQTRRRALKAYQARRSLRLRSKMSPALRNFLMLFMILVCPLLFAHMAQACTPNCSQPSSEGPSRPVMGIDLGTTYSVVGVMKDGKLHIVRSSLIDQYQFAHHTTDTQRPRQFYHSFVCGNDRSRQTRWRCCQRSSLIRSKEHHIRHQAADRQGLLGRECAGSSSASSIPSGQPRWSTCSQDWQTATYSGGNLRQYLG